MKPARRTDWYVVSAHGSILFYIAMHPGCTAEEIAETMHLTRRTVWGLVGDLRRAGMLSVRRSGRYHFYRVNEEAEFPHPAIKGVTIGTVVNALLRDSEKDFRTPAASRFA